MKRIVIVSVGGTIDMKTDETGVKPTDRHTAEQLQYRLSEFAHIELQPIFNLPSPHLTFDHLEKLRDLILDIRNRPDVDGVVVTHGTDTLEETAYFLDIQLPPGIPVVLTGAMRSSDEIAADGPANLLQAVCTAACGESANKGVLVAWNGEIHSAHDVVKTHTSRLDAFQSPQTGPLGSVDSRSVTFYHIPAKHEYFPSAPLTQSVGLVKMAIGMDSGILHYLINKGSNGLVIEALGQGNVPPAAVPGIQAAIAKGIPVVIVSRCLRGKPKDVYGYEGGGKHLREMGVIFSNGINGPKARLKLMVLLGCQFPLDAIRAAFEQ
ncbi:asparaginase [Effusibacillus dendaii]|uniref:L-asparaginase n=1 Tax=Effusibacillus dendaii TaxID=2743772 RepID=A0A7I8D959_9BACL|nr:asparaginase [Effusibacillus dendaii]BCJ85356.1 L-asparaginase [Effusibacillus dendaii]